jgi:leader peptidase (prepilin peptidase)/N-methyltransferase
MSFVGWLGQPAVLPWVSLVFGLCVGSFLNVVIHRLPKMLEREWRAQCAELAAAEGPVVPRGPGDAQETPYNLWTPRSACPGCGKAIAAKHNIPVLSWILLRGRCAACQARIKARYPLVELAGGLVAAYAAVRFGPTLAAFAAMVFCWTLIALTAIDLDTQLLPDDITLPLVWAGLAFNLGAIFVPLASAVIGAIAGYLALWSVYWGFKLLTGKEGMGYGDFKLLAAIGAWLGWQMLPLVILLSSIVGAAVGIALMAFAGHGRDKPIPFGPYLAAAGVIALFWGADIAARWIPLVQFK